MAQHFYPSSNYSFKDLSETGIVHGNSSNENKSNIENYIIFKTGVLSAVALKSTHYKLREFND